MKSYHLVQLVEKELAFQCLLNPLFEVKSVNREVKFEERKEINIPTSSHSTFWFIFFNSEGFHLH
jgi:hypothetical protein